MVKEFLDRHYLSKKPLLLGYSGGPDSKALLYALLECGKNLPLHLAHIDHGWREESADEAMSLKIEAEKLNLPFHHCRLDLKDHKNIEAVCREKRLLFFSEVLEKIKGEALLLAHQKNDVTETVLKRVFEGAHLPHLYGLKETATLQGMPIWRPLLSISKEEIYQFLKERSLSWIEDPTNHESYLLRGRMRSSLIPLLEGQFGKEIQENLYLLGKRSDELNDYLQTRVSPLLEGIKKGPFGRWLNFNIPLHSIERRYLLLQFLGFTPKRGDLEQMLAWIEQKEPDKEMGQLFFDRGFVFSIERPISFPEGWEIKTQKTSQNESRISSWIDFLLGKVELILPEGEYEFRPPGKAYGAFKKLWSEHHVPAFLREKLPILFKKGIPYQELLTGIELKNLKHSSYLHIIVNYK